MTGEQERRAVALKAIDRFCAEHKLGVPPLTERRRGEFIELRGWINGREFAIGYEADKPDWLGIGWVAALNRAARSRRFFRDLSLDDLCLYLAYGNEGCVGVNAGRARREFRKREAKACAA